MPIVSTGQITIVDNNDAKPITAYITANPGTQQVFSKDESTVSWLPDWTTANSGAGLVLTAKAFVGAVGAAQDITGALTNVRWSTNLATALTGTNASIAATPTLAAIFGTGTFTMVANTSGSTLTIKSNMLETVPQGVIYFEGDYTDLATGLVSRVVAQVTLNLVRTGTNAVYIQTKGSNAIEASTGTTKNVAVVAADLIRASGVDTTGVTYRFYDNNGATQVITGASFSTKYGLKLTGAAVAPTASASDVGLNLPASGAWSANNTLVIHESAVNDMGVYRVEAKDADGTIYQTYFTVYDVSDPYEIRVDSSTGDKLQNGVGSTNLTPDVWYGGVRVPSLAGWTFTWTFYNRDGKRGAFIDTTRTAVAAGRDITANTAGASAVITYSGTAITFAAGNIIKCVTVGGSERFYEVASATGNTVTIRTPSTNTWLNFTDYPAPAVANDFLNGKLFVCAGASGGQVTTSAGAALTLTGYEVDGKARVVVEANRP